MLVDEDELVVEVLAEDVEVLLKLDVVDSVIVDGVIEIVVDKVVVLIEGVFEGGVKVGVIVKLSLGSTLIKNYQILLNSIFIFLNDLQTYLPKSGLICIRVYICAAFCGNFCFAKLS